MLKINKFTFLLAFWLILGSLNHVNAAPKNSANSPSFSAENSGDPEKSLKVGTEPLNSLDNQDPTCLISTFTFRGTYKSSHTQPMDMGHVTPRHLAL